MARNSKNNDLVEPGKEDSTNRQLIEKLFDVQTQEIDVRRTEILVRKDDLQNQKDIAVRSIDAQAKDREQSRVTFGKESTKHKLFSGFALIAVMAFVLLLVFQGETQLAKEIGVAALGAVGGYGYAMQKANRTKNNSDS